MNVIHSVEDNNSQTIHVSVSSNDRGATGEKGDSVANLRITEENRLEATLSNGQTIDGGAVPAIKTRRIFVADMNGTKRTYILPLNIESSQVSYILMNGVAYSDGYVLQSGEITLNYDDLPTGRLEVVINDNSGGGDSGNTTINGKNGDIKLKTINGATLDEEGDIELATLDAFNNEIRTREEANNEFRNTLNNHDSRISNNENTINSHSDNLTSLNANISSINNQMTVLADDVHEVTDNYVPRTRRINDKFLSHDMRLTANDVEALPITAGITHPVRGELVVNGHVTAENATQDNHLVTKAQLDAKVAEVVNSAPETLDTLEELSKALGDDPNFATTVANRIGTVDKKIDIEVNKLSNKVEVNTESLKNTTQKANTNSTNISLLNSTVATNKLSSDTQFSNVAKEQTDQNILISDIFNALSAESEKGTNLKLNSSATKVLGVSIYGNTEQTRTSGKNLLKLPNGYVNNGDIKVSIANDIIYCKGTSTRIMTANLTTPTSYPMIAGTYTFSIKKPISNSMAVMVNNKQVCLLAKNTRTQTFTLPESGKSFFLQLHTELNKPVDLKIEELMIERGNTSTNYEPYTGGYNNLSDEFSELPRITDGITATNQNGVLKLTGLPTRGWVNVQQQVITPLLVNGGTYTLVNYNVTDKGYLELSRQKKDGSWEHINSRNKKTLTFTVDFDTYSLYKVQINMGPVASYNGQTVTSYNNYALFQGNYDENNLPEYSPYNTGLASPRPQFPQVVKELSSGNIKVISKNLLKVKNLTFSQTRLETTVNSDNSITVQGENKNFWGMNTTDDEAIPFIATGTKLTLSVDRPLPEKLAMSCWTKDGATSKQISPVQLERGQTSKTFTANQDFLSGHLLFQGMPVGKKINATFKVQLEIGDTATPFVPHESSEFTIPSGLNLYKLTDNIYDEIKLENGVAKLIKRVGKLELSGDEEKITYYYTSKAGTIGFKYKNPSSEIIFTQQNSVANIICSHFNAIDEDAVYTTRENKTGVAIYGGYNNFPRYSNTMGFWFTVPDQLNLGITDVASFKNWLKSEKDKGTPVTIYYEMKTPTEEEITDPALLTELKKLMGMRTYRDVTNISVTGAGLTPEIKVKYMRKIGG